jgi:hypothetical protein
VTDLLVPDAIQTREDLANWIRALVATLDEEASSWENADLASYLEAMAAWLEDMDGYFEGVGEPVPLQPSWKLIGQILAAARVYE